MPAALSRCARRASAPPPSPASRHSGAADAPAATAQVGVDAGKREVGHHHPEEHERRPAERLRARAAELHALEQRVDPEPGEQADREGQQELHPAPVDPADPGQPEHADRHRDHADVEADQRHQAVEADVGVGGLRGHVDRGVDRPAGGGQEPDLVALALDPRVLHPDHVLVEALDDVVILREGGEGVVDRHLLDRDRVGPVVRHVHRDLARGEHRSLHHELLDRHAAPVEPGSVERDEQRDHEPQHDERKEAHRPSRKTAGEAAGRLRAERQGEAMAQRSWIGRIAPRTIAGAEPDAHRVTRRPRRSPSSQAPRIRIRERGTCTSPCRGSAARGCRAAPGPA